MSRNNTPTPSSTALGPRMIGAGMLMPLVLLLLYQWQRANVLASQLEEAERQLAKFSHLDERLYGLGQTPTLKQ